MPSLKIEITEIKHSDWKIKYMYVCKIKIKLLIPLAINLMVQIISEVVTSLWQRGNVADYCFFIFLIQFNF